MWRLRFLSKWILQKHYRNISQVVFIILQFATILGQCYWKHSIKKHHSRYFPGSPVVKTSPSSVGGAGLIPGWGAQIPHALQPKNQNLKQKQYCNKFNKDLKKKKHHSKCWGYCTLCCKTVCNYIVPILDNKLAVSERFLISIGKHVWDNIFINQIRKHQR